MQSAPVQPFSQVHVSGRVQLPSFGHLRQATFESPSSAGTALSGVPKFRPLARSSVAGKAASASSVRFVSSSWSTLCTQRGSVQSLPSQPAPQEHVLGRLQTPPL